MAKSRFDKAGPRTISIPVEPTDRIERESRGTEPFEEFLPSGPALIDAPVAHLIGRIEVLTVERPVDAGAHRQRSPAGGRQNTS